MKREEVRDTGLNNLNSAAYRQVLLKYLVGTGRAEQSESSWDHWSSHRF